jgi:hypothetical protein
LDSLVLSAAWQGRSGSTPVSFLDTQLPARVRLVIWRILPVLYRIGTSEKNFSTLFKKKVQT